MQELYKILILTPQNAFWAPKCSLAKRGQGVYTSFATAVEENDMSKMMKFMKNQKLVKVKTEKTYFEIKIKYFCKFHHESDHFYTLHQRVEKQMPNGVNFDQNRKNRTFEPKITF